MAELDWEYPEYVGGADLDMPLFSSSNDFIL